MTTASLAPAGLTAGIWNIDTAHSEVSFVVRHLGLFKVRGSFAAFEGMLTVASEVTESVVEVEVDMSSVDTRDPNRDNHLRSPEFFDAAQYPKMTFRSTALRINAERACLVGDLTIRGVTRPLELEVEAVGILTDPMGLTRVGFVAHGELLRSEFGMAFNMPLSDGGVMLSDKVRIELDIQAVRQADLDVS
ncbi:MULTISPECIES: YceI family protein [Frankia]|uniref:YceI family protein n=1 Tax=Frankia TaxID=1854 RepID=UPI000461B2C6|nr:MULTISPECIES: YceI family protein [Frankia]KDA41652.1 hypothetical protein BMG523Draft_03528 [Frankia sp. BMG5.23]KEZ34702.1 hypothetical protein CEDDRAFT_03953 [Frankia sp. CeD]ORT95339.1 polyisoprenoid-binding protein [Frankia casuarinae]